MRKSYRRAPSPIRWACWIAARSATAPPPSCCAAPPAWPSSGVPQHPRIAGCALVSGKLITAEANINDEDVSRRAAQQAWDITGYGPEDIDLIEMHDCFTIAEIVRLEGLGVVPVGEGGRWAENGNTALGGKLPVNASGGLLSRGHPVGATGVAQICELTWQLSRRAGQRQVDDANTGLAYCKGGTVSGTDGGSVTALIVSR